MKKISKILNTLDSVADNIETQNERIALAIDQISDRIEKTAYFNPSLWLPGRNTKNYLFQQKLQISSDGKTMMMCQSCGEKIRANYNCCPKCGARMIKIF